MKIKSYKELIAYQKGYELAKEVYQTTRNFPKEELYSLTIQLRRSAVSVPSNIAEGYMRGSKEYIQFLKIALGSCAELETQLSLSFDIGYCREGDFKRMYDLNIEVTKLLRSYLRTLCQ